MSALNEAIEEYFSTYRVPRNSWTPSTEDAFREGWNARGRSIETNKELNTPRSQLVFDSDGFWIREHP